MAGFATHLPKVKLEPLDGETKFAAACTAPTSSEPLPCSVSLDIHLHRFHIRLCHDEGRARGGGPGAPPGDGPTRDPPRPVTRSKKAAKPGAAAELQYTPAARRLLRQLSDGAVDKAVVDELEQYTALHWHQGAFYVRFHDHRQTIDLQSPTVVRVSLTPEALYAEVVQHLAHHGAGLTGEQRIEAVAAILGAVAPHGLGAPLCLEPNPDALALRSLADFDRKRPHMDEWAARRRAMLARRARPYPATLARPAPLEYRLLGQCAAHNLQLLPVPLSPASPTAQDLGCVTGQDLRALLGAAGAPYAPPLPCDTEGAPLPPASRTRHVALVKANESGVIHYKLEVRAASSAAVGRYRCTTVYDEESNNQTKQRHWISRAVPMGRRFPDVFYDTLRRFTGGRAELVCDTEQLAAAVLQRQQQAQQQHLQQVHRQQQQHHHQQQQQQQQQTAPAAPQPGAPTPSPPASPLPGQWSPAPRPSMGHTLPPASGPAPSFAPPVNCNIGLPLPVGFTPGAPMPPSAMFPAGLSGSPKEGGAAGSPIGVAGGAMPNLPTMMPHTVPHMFQLPPPALSPQAQRSSPGLPVPPHLTTVPAPSMLSPIQQFAVQPLGRPGKAHRQLPPQSLPRGPPHRKGGPHPLPSPAMLQTLAPQPPFPGFHPHALTMPPPMGPFGAPPPGPPSFPSGLVAQRMLVQVPPMPPPQPMPAPTLSSPTAGLPRSRSPTPSLPPGDPP